MRKDWDLIARYVRRDDPETVYFVKMKDMAHFACSCGGSSVVECRHIQHAKQEVVDERGTIALDASTPRPPKKHGDRRKQMRWWVERNVCQFLDELDS